jgi:hypothetical protein
MAHYIGITRGQIEIRPSGGNVPARFFSEKNAARYLARAILRTGVSGLLNSSSCNWPEDSGRRAFDYDAFLDRVAIDLRSLDNGTPNVLGHSGPLPLPDQG